MDEAWPRALEVLRRAASDPAADEWTIVSAAGLGKSSLDDARREVAVIVDAARLQAGAEVIDLGSGLGRHLLALAEHGIDGTGVEASATLGRIARDILGVRTYAASMVRPDLGGSVDAVLCLSDTIGLFDSPTRRQLFRAARGLLDDHGRLVLQVSTWPNETFERTVSWPPVGSTAITETISGCGANAVHDFELVDGSGTARRWEIVQYCPTVDELSDELSDAGFRAARLVACADGSDLDAPAPSQDCFLIGSAVPGFNYLADLESFLEAWADDAHERNRRPVVEHRTGDGRYTNSRRARVGQGETLTRHHPRFADCLEPGIRPLVGVLAHDLGQIPYSSCEGHQLASDPATTTDAYVGLVGLTPEAAEHLAAVLTKLVAGTPTGSTALRVRCRRLHGPTISIDAVDLVFERPRTTSWDRYRDEVRASVEHLVATIARCVEEVGPLDGRSAWAGSK